MHGDILTNLEWFNAYAASGRAPRWTMGTADIHGFLTGLSIAGSLPDSEWTSLIWSGEVPQFASRQEEWNVMSDLLAYEEQIRRSLGSYRILNASVLPDAGDGWFYAADWAEGFLQAIEANPHPWQRAVDIAESSLQVVLATCYHNHEDSNSGYVTAQGVDEINYHLRHLNRIMQTVEAHMPDYARAA